MWNRQIKFGNSIKLSSQKFSNNVTLLLFFLYFTAVLLCTFHGIQEVSCSIPLISAMTQGTLLRESPEIKKFQDFYYALKILTLGADRNLTGTHIRNEKSLIECIHCFLIHLDHFVTHQYAPPVDQAIVHNFAFPFQTVRLSDQIRSPRLH